MVKEDREHLPRHLPEVAEGMLGKQEERDNLIAFFDILLTVDQRKHPENYRIEKDQKSKNYHD